MGLFTGKGFWSRLVWPWAPDTDREAGSGIVANFLLHWFSNRISLKSFAFGYSFYLGTISFVLFMILTVTGVVLMFMYVPSVERAYWSIKDLEFAVSFGWLLRRTHRLCAHPLNVPDDRCRIPTGAPGALDGIQEIETNRQVACNRAESDERLVFPRESRGSVVLLNPGTPLHQWPRGSVGSQSEIDSEGVPVFSVRGQVVAQGFQVCAHN